MTVPDPTPIPPSAAGDTHPVSPGDPGMSGGNPPIPPVTPTVPKGDQPGGENFVLKTEHEKIVAQSSQNFARAKSAEEKLRDYRDKFGELPGGGNPPPPRVPASNITMDPIEIASVVSQLKDFDQAELRFAAKISKADGISPVEAVKTPEFLTWLRGKRDQDLRDNKIPKPGANSPTAGLPEANAIGQMSNDDFARLERDTNQKIRGGGGV